MKRSLVAALVAVVLAVIGCVSVLLYVRGAENRALAGKDPVKVVIAAKKIPVGTTGARIRSGGFTKVVNMPSGSVPVGEAMSDVDPSLDELVVTADVEAGRLLLRGAFGEASKLSNLAMPEGKLAVSFPVKCIGSLQVGFKIAIFDTFNSVDGSQHIPNGSMLSFDAANLQVTRLVLPKVEVIGVAATQAPASGNGNGNANQGGGGSTGAGNGNTANGQPDGQSAAASADCGTGAKAMVTVGVTQDEAEKLIHAMQTGTLAFAIVDDKSDVKPGPGVDSKHLFG